MKTAREVDIKALVSHVVKGDGINKCRICMGDTSEGQVHLNDAVTMDGDRPVTLSEILEIITGVEVQLEDEMPVGLCSTCATSALLAADFRSLCRQATERWETSLQLLGNLHVLDTADMKNAIWVILGHNEMTVTDPGPVPDTAAPKKTRRNIKIKEYRNYKLGTCQCSECGKKFRYPQELCQHLKESTDYKRACYICAEIMSRDEMVTHMLEVHDRKPYDCKSCPALLRSATQYKRHMVNAHSKGFVFCGECGRNFKSKHGLNAHQSVHVPKSCPKCDKLFRNQTCYVYHVRKCCSLDSSREDAYRTKKKVFFQVDNTKTDRKIKVGMRGSADTQCICDYCGKQFAGKKFVCAHIQIVHMKNTHRPCKHCGKMLAAAHMTEHVKKHELVQMFNCEYCGVVLRTRLGYVQHVRLHTGEKPYRCQHCGETFSASSRRSAHIRRAHTALGSNLRHACEYCPARFRLPYRLKRHVLTVHNVKPDGPSVSFECEKCHERFASCRGLVHHGRKHQEQYANRILKRDAKFKVHANKVDTPLTMLKPAKFLEKVEEGPAVPRGICRECYEAAVASYSFKRLATDSVNQWTRASAIIFQIQEPTDLDGSVYVCYDDNSVIRDQECRISDVKQAVERLNYCVQTKIEKVRKRWRTSMRCPDCNMNFVSPFQLNQHLKGTVNRACRRCGLIVPREGLAKHLQKDHGKILSSCKVCYQLFDDDSELAQHKISLHGPNAHVCHVCGTGFEVARALRAHIYIHSLFSCSNCNASFENRKCATYHQSQCKVDKRLPSSMYECHDCGRKYAHKGSLRVHIVQKHLNVLPYVCQICGKRSSTIGHQRAHEATHMTHRKMYHCFCGAKMRTSLGFNMHQRIHTGEKPYACKQCSARFISASRRLDHMIRKHGGAQDMKHACSHCEARFLRPIELKKHILSTH